jgi:RNA polymerase sigma-70 factor (ECF subfamily)
VGARDRSTAFAAVYDDHVYDVYGFFGYRVRSREEAEDLTQVTFERALRAWDRFDPTRSAPRTWLLAIARNLLVDHYRRDRSASQESISENESDEARIGHAPGLDEDLGLSPELSAALARLPERERELIALRFGGELTGPEIAELTGLTLDNVHQILSRSLRRLRAMLAGKTSTASQTT